MSSGILGCQQQQQQQQQGSLMDVRTMGFQWDSAASFGWLYPGVSGNRIPHLMVLDWISRQGYEYILYKLGPLTVLVPVVCSLVVVGHSPDAEEKYTAARSSSSIKFSSTVFRRRYANFRYRVIKTRTGRLP